MDKCFFFQFEYQSKKVKCFHKTCHNHAIKVVVTKFYCQNQAKMSSGSRILPQSYNNSQIYIIQKIGCINAHTWHKKMVTV